VIRDQSTRYALETRAQPDVLEDARSIRDLRCSTFKARRGASPTGDRGRRRLPARTAGAARRAGRRAPRPGPAGAAYSDVR